LRVHDSVVDVREDLELVGHADVVSVRRETVRNDPLTHLAILERLDHAVLECHALDPPVGFSRGHSLVSRLRAPASVLCSAIWLPSSQQHHYQREHDAGNEGRGEREIEREVPPANREVTRQPANRQPERHQDADTSNEKTQDNECSPHVTLKSTRAPGRSIPARRLLFQERRNHASRCVQWRCRNVSATCLRPPWPDRLHPSSRATL